MNPLFPQFTRLLLAIHSLLLIGSLLLITSCGDGGGGRRGPNRPPKAVIAMRGEHKLGKPVTFDAAGSSDPDGDPLSIEWEVVEKPAASNLSTASLTLATAATSILVPDAPGGFQVRLTVSDGRLVDTASALVIIENGDGDNDDTPPADPAVDLICPDRGFLRGGDAVTLFGGSFPPDTRVLFGTSPGLDPVIEAEGSRLTVRTPAASAAGAVDVTLQVGDRAFLLPQTFRYIPGPLSFSTQGRLDLLSGRSPHALAAAGDGRVLGGFDEGEVQLFLPTPEGGLAPAGIAPALRGGRVVRLRTAARDSSGSVEIGAVSAAAPPPSVVRVSATNELTILPLDFEGKAVDIDFADLDGSGRNQVLVADQDGRRLVVYTAVSGTGADGFAPTAEFATEGVPCAVSAAELDGDAGREVLVGCFPGPEVTWIDFETDGPHVSHLNVPIIDGIIQIEPGRITGGAIDELAALTVMKDEASGGQLNSIRFYAPRPRAAGGGEILLKEILDRFDVAVGRTSIGLSDLDLDGDLDAALYDASSGDAILLVNTRIDGPQSREVCEAIARGGAEPVKTAFRVQRVPMFTAAGIQALIAADVDGDGLPELIGSHESELLETMLLPNVSGE